MLTFPLPEFLIIPYYFDEPPTMMASKLTHNQPFFTSLNESSMNFSVLSPMALNIL
jgi:hypothetical protein